LPAGLRMLGTPFKYEANMLNDRGLGFFFF
jgi:hypothetical protein